MSLRSTTNWLGVVLDTRDPRGLADFYQRLLGWPIHDASDTWVTVAPDSPSGFNLAFQLEPLHVAPIWPAQEGAQQMQCHLDIGVDDVASATQFAIECGAQLAQRQPQSNVRVLLDPAGHPFCLYLDAD